MAKDAPVVKASEFKDPYIRTAPNPQRNMAGKGAPVSTIFSVVGASKMEPEMKSLGGLVKDSKTAPIQPGTLTKPSKAMKTEKGILGPVSKTKIPGAHYAQVPYPGAYMVKVGPSL